jgi:asparagine synthase (glutamine-hydrolysing)
MCGIFGVFGTKIGERAVEAALRALAPRGPDGAACAAAGEAGLLGHTRLAIVDLDARADQPMRGLGGRLAIVFNGEIYNAPELRRQLADYPWITDHSDTETILAAYARWGEGCVERLRGMFAFALWDAAEERLLLAVDRFSIKPLLLAEHRGALYFASTAAALGRLGMPLAPHLPAVHSWLADGQLETGPATFFEGIRQLPAAHIGIWQDGRLAMRRYWAPPEAAPRPIGADEAEAWVAEALNSHLLSDVPVGLNLSSGLDSAVLHAMARAGGQPLHAFTFSFPGTVYDEAARARPVIGTGDAWSVTPIEPRALWRDLAAATDSLETPLGGVAIYGHWRNARTARDAGYKVLLAGEGADEVFGGYKYYAEAAIADLWREGDRNGAERLFAQFASQDPDEWRGSAAALAARRDAGGEARLKAPDGTSLASGFLTRPFAATPKLSAPPAIAGEPVRAAMWSDLAYLKLPKLLRWQDRCYMASSVEVRVPYLDHVLVERMAAASPAALFAGGVTKAPLRRMAERLLPAVFLARPKLYVATPQREWLKRELRQEVEDLLDPGAALVASGLVDLPALGAAYRAYADDAALGNSFFIWKYIAMEHLFQCFFRTPGERVRLVA